jgi:hypothetical protein
MSKMNWLGVCMLGSDMVELLVSSPVLGHGQGTGLFLLFDALWWCGGVAV